MKKRQVPTEAQQKQAKRLTKLKGSELASKFLELEGCLDDGFSMDDISDAESEQESFDLLQSSALKSGLDKREDNDVYNALRMYAKK